MQDNSDLQVKLMLRNRAFEFYDVINTVIDYYAGQCVIANMLWSNIANNVTCIDKTTLKEPVNKNINRIVGDNKNYLDLSKTINVIDCDAYGLVMPFIKEIVGISEVSKLIFFTDGTPTRQKRFKCATREFQQHIDEIKPDYVDYFLNQRKTAYYGVMAVE